MHTTCSSNCHRGSPHPLVRSPQLPPWVWAWTRSPSASPLGVGLDQIPLNFPLGCGPQPDPPQLSPWVWASTRSPSTFPLGVGLDQIPLNFPLGCGPGPDPSQLPPWVWAWRPPQPDPPKLSLWVWPWKPARHAGITPSPKDQAPPPPGPGTPLGPGTPPPCEHNSWHMLVKIIPLPQTSFAGGNNCNLIWANCTELRNSYWIPIENTNSHWMSQGSGSMRVWGALHHKLDWRRKYCSS